MDCIAVNIKPWKPSSYLLRLSVDPHGTASDCNLMEWFNDPPLPKFYKKNVDKDERLWFLESAVQNGKSNNLSAFVNQATALDNGYKTVLKNQDTNSWHLKCFRHDCVRSRKTTDRNTQSMKPLEQHQRCKFYVAVSYCPEEKLFYVRKNSGCNFTHHGHPPIPRDQIVLGIKQIPDECRKDTEEMLASHVPIAAVNEMIKIRTNNHVTGDSLKHLRRVVMAAKTGGTIDSNRSPAQLALDILRESKGCNYSYLSASMDRATSLVSIRKGSWKKGKKSTSLVDAASEEEQEPYEAYIDDERKRYVQSVLKSLSLGEDEVLLAVAFATEEGYNYHRKFPRVLGMDTTNGTNNEKRGLAKIVGKTNCNKNIPIMEIIIPSEQTWVFQHIISAFLPTLLDVDALHKTSIILTDQCDEEMNAVCHEILKEDSGVFNANTSIRICKWHKVNRNYQKKVTKYTDTVDQEFIHQIINWLYSITNNVETESEENDSMEKLHQYIDMQHSSGLVSDALINFTADYITKSYVPWLRFLSGARYTRTFCGHFADTGFVESENAQLVKNPFAPTPNNNLNTTCDKLLLMSDNRFRVLKRNDTASFLSHTTKQTQRHLDNSLQVALSSSLSDLSAKKILEEYEAREKLLVCEVTTEHDSAMNSRSFFVCRGNTNYSLQETEAAGWIPMYIRTRSVTVRELKIDGYQHVLCTCSCKTFYHNLVQCRHVFAILGRSPSHLDAFPECRKDYALWYGDDRQPDFNAKVDKRTKLLEHFGGMIYEGTLDNNIQIDSSLLREHDEDLFGETYDGNPRRSVQWTTGAGWRPSGTVPCTAPSPKRPMRSTTQNKFHTRIFEGSAFLQLRKLFEHICNLAVTPAQIAELRELLDRCHQRMLITGVDSKNTSDTGRVIMNNNDREDTNDNGREVMNDIEDNGMHDIEDVEDDGMSQVEFTRKTTIHGLQSFSAICKAQTRKRLRPVSSPPKR